MSQAQAVSVEERIDQLESREAIKTLMADYAFGCDQHDRDRFMRIWHDDAEYVVGGIFGTANGAPEIEKTLEGIWASSPETHHWITNVTVNFDMTHAAEGDAHTICYVKNSEGDELFVSCDYANRYERRGDGDWRLAVCKLDVHWWKKVELETL
jgi:ketosteroid isomerase-like protein